MHTYKHTHSEFFYYVGKLTGRLQNILKLVNESSGWHYQLVHIVKLQYIGLVQSCFNSASRNGAGFFCSQFVNPQSPWKIKLCTWHFQIPLIPFPLKASLTLGALRISENWIPERNSYWNRVCLSRNTEDSFFSPLLMKN